MRKTGKKLAGLLACLSIFQGSKFVHEPIVSGINFNSKNKLAFNKIPAKYFIPTVVTPIFILAALGTWGASQFLTKNLVKIKFRFAGSGDLLWRKAFKNPKVDNEYVTSNSNRGSAFYEFGKLCIGHSKDDLKNVNNIKKLFGINNNLKILAYDQSANKYLLYEVSQESYGKDATTSWCAVDSIYKIKTTNLEDKNEKFDEIICDTAEKLTQFVIEKHDNILEYFNSSEEKKFYGQLEKEKTKEINDLDLAKMLQKYGKLLKLKRNLKNGTREVWVWKKEITKTKKLNNDWLKSKIHQIEFTIPGPQEQDGVLDKGQFSIIRNIVNGYSVLENEINKHLGEGNKIHVSVKGHSRGGVAANIVLNEIVNQFGNNSNVEFSSVAFDPVPGNSEVSNMGFFNFFGVSKNHKTFKEQYGAIDLNNTKNSAVIYTLKSGYETLGPLTKNAYVDFQPQKIFNSKVTIISEINSNNVHGATGHGVGTQMVEKDENSGKFHKRYFHFEGKKYSQGNLWQLPAGLYWADNGFNLYKMDGDKNRSFTEGKLKFIKDSGSDKVDKMRKEFLKTLIEQHME